MKAIVNGRLIVPDEHGDFTIASGRILLYEKEIIWTGDDLGILQNINPKDVTDAKGCFVSPGFVNVHIHGCAGCDTMDGASEDGSPAALLRIARFQASTGVTSFLPTTMTCSLPAIWRSLDSVRTSMRCRTLGARILGAHMEGPFIGDEYRGAQPEENILMADFKKIEEYADVIRLMTLASESLGDDGYDFLCRCREAGIVLSLGHSGADYETSRELIENCGINHVTHLFNGMRPLHHRHPGLVGAALDSGAYVELIADDLHVHPMAQRLVWQMRQGWRIVLITDSIRATGLGDGVSELGGQTVCVKDGAATLADGTLAGSVLTMERALANFTRNTMADIPSVVMCATRFPAESLGLYEELGSIEPGKRADITIFDESFRVVKTMVGGDVVFDGEAISHGASSLH